MAGYSSQVIEHFENPRNVGVIADPDGQATASNPVCGDQISVTLRIVEDRIEEMRWQTRGCPPAIATSSFASELVRGWSLEEADQLTRERLAELIGGLPAAKIHCSVLATDAIQLAIRDYRDKREAEGNESKD